MIPDGVLATQAYFASFMYPMRGAVEYLRDYEMAGEGLNNGTSGMMVKVWRLQVVNENREVQVSAPGVAWTTLFTHSEPIKEAALAFDNNMNPFVTFIDESLVARYYWFDPIANAMVFSTLPTGTISTRCCVDERRPENNVNSDVILSYVRGGTLYARYQRERYQTEHTLQTGLGSLARLIDVGMARNFRVLWWLRDSNPIAGSVVNVDPYLGDVILSLCQKADILPENVNVADLYRDGDLVPGMKVDIAEGLDKPITWLMEMLQIVKSQHDKKLFFSHKGKEISFRIPYKHLIVNGNEMALKQEMVDPAELPRRVNVNHIDPTAGFAKNKQTATRRTNMMKTDKQLNIESQVVLTPDQAATAALTVLKAKHLELFDYEFSTGIRYSFITPGDVGEVEDARGVWHRVRIEEKDEDSKVIDWEATLDAGPLTYIDSSAEGKQLDPPVSTAPGLVGDTDLHILNIPIQRDQNDELGLYLAMRGAGSGWTGATVYYSIDGGTTYIQGFTVENAANIGETVTSVDGDDTTVEVLVPYPIASVSPAQIAAGENRAIIGDEEIQYETATLLGMVDGLYHYELTGIVRGILYTEAEPWAGGIRFIPLDDAVIFVQVQRAQYGQELFYKAVSIGQSPDEVTALSFDFTQAMNQTEWPVQDLVMNAAPGGGVKVSWEENPRLGTFGVAPFHSKYFRGHRVKFSNGYSVDVPASGGTTPVTTVPIPADLSAWVAQHAGWSVAGGFIQYDPTVSANAESRLYLNLPIDFADGSGLTFRAECDVTAAGTGSGAVAGVHLLAGVYHSITLGTQVNPHSTVIALPKTGADEITIGLFADTDGTNVVSFQNMKFSLTGGSGAGVQEVTYPTAPGGVTVQVFGLNEITGEGMPSPVTPIT